MLQVERFEFEAQILLSRVDLHRWPVSANGLFNPVHDVLEIWEDSEASGAFPIIVQPIKRRTKRGHYHCIGAV